MALVRHACLIISGTALQLGERTPQRCSRCIPALTPKMPLACSDVVHYEGRVIRRCSSHLQKGESRVAGGAGQGGTSVHDRPGQQGSLTQRSPSLLLHAFGSVSGCTITSSGPWCWSVVHAMLSACFDEASYRCLTSSQQLSMWERIPRCPPSAPLRTAEGPRVPATNSSARASTQLAIFGAPTGGWPARDFSMVSPDGVWST